MDSILAFEQAAAVSSERHRDWSVDRAGFAYSRRTNSVPLTSVEFPRAAREYPIVFAESGESVSPIAILGLKDKENLYIGDDGDWNADYVPAYVRRYPFLFSTNDKGKTFTLCIDEGFAGCNQEGRGERLFTDEGKKTPYLDRVLAFLQGYQAEHRKTTGFCARLKGLDILEPMQANVALKTGEKLALTGFNVVSREKLSALDAGELKSLLEDGTLELVYGHLQSLENFASMIDRLAARAA